MPLSPPVWSRQFFLGLSAGGVLKVEMVKEMAAKPLILALANPTPEILPELALEVRPDAILATGRADFPNLVNNVLVFPFLFRGALDAGATTVTREMEIAAVNALAELARQEQSDIVATAYGIRDLSFGPEYLIPKPFDPRLIVKLAPAVAKAAMDSGVAERPIEDMEAYEQHLQQFVYQSGTTMKPIFQLARSVEPEKKRIVFAEGEEESVLHAVRIIIDEKLAKPILIGRPAVIEQRVARYGLRLVAGHDYTVVNTDHDERYRDFWQEYYKLMSRKGITQQMAKLEMRRRTTLIGALLVKRGEADGMICGMVSTTHRHLHFIDQVIGKKEGAKVYAAMNALVLPGRQIFLVDTHVNVDPTAEELSEITIMAAEEVRRFGIEPKIAPVVAFELRFEQCADRAENARHAGDPASTRTTLAGGRGNAWRSCARPQAASRSDAGFDARRRREPARAAKYRRSQHFVQPAENGRGQQRCNWLDSAGRGAASACVTSIRDGAPDRQYDGAAGGGRDRA
ncbi:hypothetical protein R75483_01101 [Paraburkholderia domus]|nr:hypothetical protein R75483_01101 [Paraburkholderia domus]